MHAPAPTALSSWALRPRTGTRYEITSGELPNVQAGDAVVERGSAVSEVTLVIRLRCANPTDLDRGRPQGSSCHHSEGFQVAKNGMSFSAEFGQQILQRVGDGQSAEHVAK